MNEEHVVALRQLGWDAHLLQWPRTAWHWGTPVDESTRDTAIWPTWSTAAPVLRFIGTDVLRASDVVVLPEPWRGQIAHFAKLPVTTVVHCQNPYYGFHGTVSLTTLADQGYRHIVTCSGYTSAFLRRMGWEGALHVVPPALGPMFRPPEDSAERRLQIAFMPQKRHIEAVFLRGLFRALFPTWANVPWVAIEKVDRDQCARILRQSTVFASLSHLEGLGLPPLEAMASGCVVAGFTGGGGADYANPSNGFWVAEGDHDGFCRSLDLALRCATNATWLQELTSAARHAVAGHSAEAFRVALDAAWRRILDRDSGS